MCYSTELDGGFSVTDGAPAEAMEYGYESDSDLDETETAEEEDEPLKVICFAIILQSRPQPSLQCRPSAIHPNPATERLPIFPDCVTKQLHAVFRIACLFPMLLPLRTRLVRLCACIASLISVDSWEALVYYTYTDNTYFLPLRSEGQEARQIAQEEHKSVHSISPMCSPKSMYRLADIVCYLTLPSVYMFTYHCMPLPRLD